MRVTTKSRTEKNAAAAQVGRKHSPETRAKKGKTLPLETCAKMAAAERGPCILR